MDIAQRLREFIAGRSDSTLIITGAEVSTAEPEAVEAFNAIFKNVRASKNYVSEMIGDGYKIVRTVNTAPGHVFEGAPDARQAATSPAPEGGPFRRRYRKLGEKEVNLHDRIKDKATELWELYDELLSYTTHSANDDPLTGAVRRDVALARTALEDSVMRAVRALTA